MKSTEPLSTTVVGSFPIRIENFADEREVFDGMRRSIELQIDAGVDFPCYGQLEDMNLMFLNHMDSIVIRENTAYIEDELKISKTIPALDYLSFAKEQIESSECRGIKMPLTGPITLASVTKVGDCKAINFQDFILEFAKVLSEIARTYDRGAGIVTIDEPSLSYATYLGIDREILLEALERVLAPLRNSTSSIHVCGKLNPEVVDILLQTRADFLDHEFFGIPENLDHYSKRVLEEYEKKLGLGSVQTNIEPELLLEIQKGKRNWKTIIETKKAIKNFILKGIKRYGMENLIVDPDCGFGGLKNYLSGNLTEKVALSICSHKLKNMSDAVKEIKDERGGMTF
ncbi:MAG: hypothetical protein ACE5K0_10630 [Candidatus Methanofastidiosia archaeon]